MTTYWPSITDDWSWKTAAGYVEFAVYGMDDQMRTIEHTFPVHVTKGYIEDNYGIPDDFDALAVAKHYANALGDLAMDMAARGLIDKDGVIHIGGV